MGNMGETWPDAVRIRVSLESPHARLTQRCRCCSTEGAFIHPASVLPCCIPLHRHVTANLQTYLYVCICLDVPIWGRGAQG